ncbi:MAG: hypothetical protein CMF50_06670 [Legionellales bacterium]|nr:hypothetical protein [Legionellales bacterium]|tara:strand:+ start:12714 stop:12917 length:204 start_codon:yes stop_codon:yes gene_type:complete
MWHYFFAALALMLVFEGIMPFLSPERWRSFVNKLALQSDRSLRIMGFVTMIIGVGILTVLHLFFDII